MLPGPPAGASQGHGTVVALLTTAILALAWLGLYWLTTARLVSAPTLVVGMALGSGVATYVLKSFKWTTHESAITTRRMRRDRDEFQPLPDIVAAGPMPGNGNGHHIYSKQPGHDNP